MGKKLKEKECRQRDLSKLTHQAAPQMKNAGQSPITMNTYADVGQDTANTSNVRQGQCVDCAIEYVSRI